MYEGVPFDFEGSLALARRLWELSEHVHRTRGQLLSSASDAMAEWRGPHAVSFVGHHAIADDSLVAAVEAMRAEALAWAQCWKSAMDEVERRRAARLLAQMADDDPAPRPRARPVAVPAAPGFAPTL